MEKKEQTNYCNNNYTAAARGEMRRRRTTTTMGLESLDYCSISLSRIRIYTLHACARMLYTYTRGIYLSQVLCILYIIHYSYIANQTLKRINGPCRVEISLILLLSI